jgi:hypothetical protein
MVDALIWSKPAEIANWLLLDAMEQMVRCKLEDATMPRLKQVSKKKRATRTAVPALGAPGLTFLAGGASASVVPTGDVQQRPNFAPGMVITLGEEELADVSLATFHLFDNENVGSGVQLAQRGCAGCRGCGGFRGCGGCRGCGGFGCRACRCGFGCGGCGFGCGGCGIGWIGIGLPWVACAGCCASWGACRWC